MLKSLTQYKVIRSPTLRRVIAPTCLSLQRVVIEAPGVDEVLMHSCMSLRELQVDTNVKCAVDVEGSHLPNESVSMFFSYASWFDSHVVITAACPNVYVKSIKKPSSLFKS